jgi:hypothetical protein
MVLNHSYPQVYPQNNLTDYIIRQSRSGVMWRIVENRALLKAHRNLLKKERSPITKPSYCQTFKPCIPEADDITDIMVCQILSNLKTCIKKSPKTGEKCR